jgi:hypothetical protein
MYFILKKSAVPPRGCRDVLAGISVFPIPFCKYTGEKKKLQVTIHCGSAEAQLFASHSFALRLLGTTQLKYNLNAVSLRLPSPEGG